MWCDSAAKMGIRELHLDLAAVTMVSSGSAQADERATWPRREGAANCQPGVWQPQTSSENEKRVDLRR